jgi:hypothetical protein
MIWIFLGSENRIRPLPYCGGTYAEFRHKKLTFILLASYLDDGYRRKAFLIVTLINQQDTTALLLLRTAASFGACYFSDVRLGPSLYCNDGIPALFFSMLRYGTPV